MTDSSSPVLLFGWPLGESGAEQVAGALIGISTSKLPTNVWRSLNSGAADYRGVGYTANSPHSATSPTSC